MSLLISLRISSFQFLSNCDELISALESSSYTGSGSGSGSSTERTYSYTFHNESSYAVTVRVEGVSTFVLVGGGTRTVNKVPEGAEIRVTCTGKNVSLDSAGSNIYIYVN